MTPVNYFWNRKIKKRNLSGNAIFIRTQLQSLCNSRQAGTGTPWAWSEWQAIAKLLQPVIDKCRAKPLLRSGQRLSDNKQWIRFGKLIWSDKHNAKWTHGSPETNETSKLWDFYFTELAAPSIQESWREGRPSDFFFTITNEAFLKSDKPVAFNPRFFFALASDIDGTDHRDLESAVRELSSRYKAILTVSIDRPWGKPFAGGFAHAIQDMAVTGLFKVGDYHSRPVTPDTFNEEWKELKFS